MRQENIEQKNSTKYNFNSNYGETLRMIQVRETSNNNAANNILKNAQFGNSNFNKFHYLMLVI